MEEPVTPILAPQQGVPPSSPQTPRRVESAAVVLVESEKESGRERGTSGSSDERRISLSADSTATAAGTTPIDGEEGRCATGTTVARSHEGRKWSGTHILVSSSSISAIVKKVIRRIKAPASKKRHKGGDENEEEQEDVEGEGKDVSTTTTSPRKRTRNGNGKSGNGQSKCMVTIIKRKVKAKQQNRQQQQQQEQGVCTIHENSETCAAATAAIAAAAVATAGKKEMEDGPKAAATGCCVRISVECDSRACKCKGRRKCLICRGCAGGHCVCESCPCETCTSREHHRLAKEKTQRETEEREMELAQEQERIFQEARERQQMRDAGMEVLPPASPVRAPLALGQHLVEQDGEVEKEEERGRVREDREGNTYCQQQQQQQQQRQRAMDPPPFVLSPGPSLVSSKG
ncbi:Hypothetical protein NocV09_02900680 [Nannochloropsis oceanica]